MKNFVPAHCARHTQEQDSFFKDNRGSLTIVAIFTILVFSLYGVLLYARSASAYLRQSDSIASIQKAYVQDVPNAVHMAQQMGADSTYVGPYFTISLNANNGSEMTTVQVIPGERLPRPSDPIKEGVDFAGWYYLEESGTEEDPIYTEYAYDFNTVPMGDIQIYAKYYGEAVMMARNSNTAFWQENYRTRISSITFQRAGFDTIPGGATTWDVQADSNCSRVAAYVVNDGNDGYALTVLSPNTIYAHTTSLAKPSFLHSAIPGIRAEPMNTSSKKASPLHLF